MRAYLPNFLSLSRFFLCPWIFVALATDKYGLALALVVVSAVTDFLDGFLARRWKVESELGSFLDPFADRFFCACGFTALMFQGLCPSWFLALLISVVILQNLGYFLLKMMRGKSGFVTQPSRLSKWNMALQCVWISVLFWLHYRRDGLFWSEAVHQGVYLGLAVLQLTVFFRYVQKYRSLIVPHFRALLFRPA